MKPIDKRRDRRRFVESRDKQFIRLNSELNDLYIARHNLPQIKLDKPIQAGYKKFFIIREDIAKGHPDRHKLAKILPKIQNVITSRNKDFMFEDYKTGEMKPRPHYPEGFDEKKWPKDLPETYRDKFFSLYVYRQHYWYTSYKRWQFVPIWMLDTRVKPRFITHVPERDGVIDTRIQEILNYFDHHNVMPRLDHLYGHSNNHWDWDRRFYYPRAHVKEEIEETMKNEGCFTE